MQEVLGPSCLWLKMEPRNTSLLQGSFYLFLDLIVISVTGWAFWFIVSKLASAAEIGYATTIISLASILAGVFGLGLEYPLLRDSSRPGVFSTATAFQVLLLTALSPILVIVGYLIYGSASLTIVTLGALYLILSGVFLTSRSSVLGLLKSRLLLLYDAIGAGTRLAIGVILVFLGLGAIGILSATIAQTALIAAGLTAVCYRRVKFTLLPKASLKQLLTLGLSNLPSKVAQLTTANLSVVLLAGFTSDPAAVGLYYIALLISLVAGSLALSLATMAIPTSTLQGEDTTTTALRYGLGFTAPLLAALLVAPQLILALIGEAYTSAHQELRLLIVGVFPSIITMNAIAKLNHQQRMKPLVHLGLIQLLSFLPPFLLLVPIYGALGAAFAVLAASLAASIPAARLLGSHILRTVAASAVSTAAGWGLGSLVAQFSPSLGVATGFTAAVAIILVSGTVKTGEVGQLVRSLMERDPSHAGSTTRGARRVGSRRTIDVLLSAIGVLTSRRLPRGDSSDPTTAEYLKELPAEANRPIRPRSNTLT